MSRPIRVSDLPEQPEPGVKLYCPECQEKYSAQRGDYFMLPLDHIMSCDDWGLHEPTPLRLVRERRILEDVEPG